MSPSSFSSWSVNTDSLEYVIGARTEYFDSRFCAHGNFDESESNFSTPFTYACTKSSSESFSVMMLSDLGTVYWVESSHSCCYSGSWSSTKQLMLIEVYIALICSSARRLYSLLRRLNFLLSSSSLFSLYYFKDSVIRASLSSSILLLSSRIVYNIKQSIVMIKMLNAMPVTR